MNTTPLLILDLDETLIHATSTPQSEDWAFEIYKYKVYLRPGLSEFLEKIRHHYQIAVWSSASDDYVEEIVKRIFPKEYPLLFIWGRSRATLKVNYDSLESIAISICLATIPM